MQILLDGLALNGDALWYDFYISYVWLNFYLLKYVDIFLYFFLLDLRILYFNMLKFYG